MINDISYSNNPYLCQPKLPQTDSTKINNAGGPCSLASYAVVCLSLLSTLKPNNAGGPWPWASYAVACSVGSWCLAHSQYFFNSYPQACSYCLTRATSTTIFATLTCLCSISGWVYYYLSFPFIHHAVSKDPGINLSRFEPSLPSLSSCLVPLAKFLLSCPSYDLSSTW